MATIELTKDNFNATIENNDVVVVDFWAPWCGPCRMQGPIIDKIAKKYEGKAKVGKLNTDENPDSAAKIGVMIIPTLIIFKNGVKVQQFIGVQSEEKLSSALDGQL